MLILFDLEKFLNDSGDQINDFLSKYTSEPAFWVITAIILFLIGCWAIRYFGRK